MSKAQLSGRGMRPRLARARRGDEVECRGCEHPDNRPQIAARLDGIERQLVALARRLGERKRARDGRTALTIRLGDEVIAGVREAAQRRGCTLSQIVREALETVIPPSSARLSDPPEHLSSFMPRTLDATRQAITHGLGQRARLAAADAATTTDRRSRDQRAVEPGMLTETMARGAGSLRGR